MKHTPGPWRIGTNYRRIFSEKPIKFIAEAHVIRNEAMKIDYGEIRSNANLISAAPVMFETLKMIRDRYAVDHFSALDMAGIQLIIEKAEGLE